MDPELVPKPLFRAGQGVRWKRLEEVFGASSGFDFFTWRKALRNKFMHRVATLFVVVALSFLGAASSLAQPNPAAKAKAPAAASVDIPIPDIKYTKFVLNNGLTVLVHEDHKAPIVAVNTWYHVGSKNELPGKTGFAHLFEHLLFTGSENYKGAGDQRAFFEAMERIGATDLNGTTSNDRTDYFENVPKNALDIALWLESDRMGHFVGAIDQDKLDKQRGVVQNEKRQ